MEMEEKSCRETKRAHNLSAGRPCGAMEEGDCRGRERREHGRNRDLRDDGRLG